MRTSRVLPALALNEAGFVGDFGYVGMNGFSHYASVHVVYTDSPMTRNDLVEIAGIAFTEGAKEYHYLHVSAHTTPIREGGEYVDVCAAGIELGWTNADWCDRPSRDFQITYNDWLAAL